MHAQLQTINLKQSATWPLRSFSIYVHVAASSTSVIFQLRAVLDGRKVPPCFPCLVTKNPGFTGIFIHTFILNEIPLKTVSAQEILNFLFKYKTKNTHKNKTKIPNKTKQKTTKPPYFSVIPSMLELFWTRMINKKNF